MCTTFDKLLMIAFFTFAIALSFQCSEGRGQTQQDKSGDEPGLAQSNDGEDQDAMSTIQKRVRTAVRENPMLRGAWITVKKSDSMHVFTVTLDSDKKLAMAQQTEFEKLLKSFVKDELLSEGQYKVSSSKSRPVKQLLAELTKRLQARGDLDGCFVYDVYFSPQDPKGTFQFLTLMGRIGVQEPTDKERQAAAEKKRDAILQISQSLLKDDPIWKTAAGELQVEPKWGDPKAKELVVVDLWTPVEPIRQRVRAAVRKTEALHGVWSNVRARLKKEDPKGQNPIVVFQPIFDTDKAAADAQKVEFGKLVATLEKDGLITKSTFEIAPQKPRPLKKLLADVNRRIAAELILENTCVSGAYIETQDAKGERQVVKFLGRVTVEGRIPNEIQTKREKLLSIAEELLSKNPAPWGLDEREMAITVSGSELKSVDLVKPIESIRKRLGEIVAKQRKLGRNEILQGTWLDIRAKLDTEDCDNTTPTFVFTPVLDSTRARQQKVEMKRLVESLVPQIDFRFAQERELPLAELLANVQDKVEIEPDLQNCLIMYAVYEQDRQSSGSLQLNLHGRVATEDQKTRIATICKHFMDCDDLLADDPVWQLSNVGANVSVSAASLDVVQPTPDAGSRFFNRGYAKFWCENYKAAHDDFRLANVASPAPRYQYWLAICELKMNQEERAYRRLKPTVWQVRGRGPLAYGSIRRSIYRIQFGLRQQLVEMEDRALEELLIKGK